MTAYRVGIIGTGSFANAHAEALKSLGDRVKIISAADTDQERGLAFCQTHHIPTYYPNAAVLLQESQPDIVHVCTPPNTHAPIVHACLGAGAHVICEKPLCGSLSTLDELQDLETMSRHFVSTVFQWRFGSAAQRLKQMIESGALGDLRVATCHTLWFRGEDYYAVPWRASWDQSLGGTTIGHGIHLIDLMLWLSPKWAEVYARLATFDLPIEVENLSLALVEFENGALGSIINSAVSTRQETYLRLDFQKATVEVRGLYSYNNSNWTFTAPDESLVTLWNQKADVPNSLAALINATLDKLDQGLRPPTSGSESRRIIEFLTALYKSAFTRQAVKRHSITNTDPFYQSMRGFDDNSPT